MIQSVFLFVVFTLVPGIFCARILAVFPVPSISHQVAFRPLTLELAKRGHEVVVITTDPIFPKGQGVANFTEIDVHDLSYSMWREHVHDGLMTTGHKEDLVNQMVIVQDLIIQIFERQMNTDKVQEIINDKTKTFDLLIVEAVVRPTLGFSHRFKIPLIQFSSFLSMYNNLETMGAPVHPFLYPAVLRQKINNLSLWDKLVEFYNQYHYESLVLSKEGKQTEAIRRIFGADTPHISELYNNIDMLFLNAHPLWDYNRPVPPSIIYLGAIHRKPEKRLPEDLKSYLDSSKYGVIYMSFGTNVSPSSLPADKIQILVRVFSALPYDVLWKWDKDDLPGRSPNIRISKWLPQSDLLRHPKIKFFITQGGLQSTDEAITAGVPLICMPMLGDQWYNAEQYVRLKIGLNLDMEVLTEERLKEAIDTILGDNSYRENIVKLRALMADQPQSALQRAVWWTEHVLRHGGARHLRSPAANMGWTDYLELELVIYILLVIICLLVICIASVYILVKFLRSKINHKIKVN